MSIGFSRQEYWGGWPFPFPVDFLASRIYFLHYTLKAISFPHSDHDLLIDFTHASLSHFPGLFFLKPLQPQKLFILYPFYLVLKCSSRVSSSLKSLRKGKVLWKRFLQEHVEIDCVCATLLQELTDSLRNCHSSLSLQNIKRYWVHSRYSINIEWVDESWNGWMDAWTAENLLEQRYFLKFYLFESSCYKAESQHFSKQVDPTLPT